MIVQVQTREDFVDIQPFDFIDGFTGAELNQYRRTQIKDLLWVQLSDRGTVTAFDIIGGCCTCAQSGSSSVSQWR